MSRLEDIRNQSSAIPHYTRAGYEKRRAPPALFAALHAYFEVQRQHPLIPWDLCGSTANRFTCNILHILGYIVGCVRVAPCFMSMHSAPSVLLHQPQEDPDGAL